MIVKYSLMTSNENKYANLRGLLEESGIRFVVGKLKIDEIQSTDALEVGKKKALAMFEVYKKPLIVDDAALYLCAYPNFPGTMTKAMLESIGLEGIGRLLSGLSHEAKLECVLTLCADGRNVKHFRGCLKGTLELERECTTALPLNSVFVPHGESVPLGELLNNKPDYVDHRRSAFAQVVEFSRKR